jgi:hypothetical protein
MSTRYKELEAISYKGARQLQDAVQNVESQIQNVSNMARAGAREEMKGILEKLRHEQKQNEDAIIQKLSRDTGNAISQLEARQKKAMQNQAQILHKAIQLQGDKFANDLQKQDEKFDTKISKLDFNIRSDMRQQEKRVNENINAVRNETISLLNNLTEHVNREFAAQQGQISDISKQVAQTQEDIRGVRQELNKIYETQGFNQATADSLLKRCSELLDECKSNIPINRFEPQRLQQLVNQLESIKLLGRNAPEAMMSSALSLLNDVWSIQEDVQMKQAVFDALFANTLASANSLLAMMQKHKDETYLKDEEGEIYRDEQGNELKVEIDYWMQGEFSNLQDKVSGLKSQLENGRNDVNFSQEKLALLLQEIKGIEIKEKEMVITAAMRGVASEERAFICQDIINSLKDNHFTVKNGSEGFENGYVGADFREGVFANMKNGLGTDITIIVEPDETLTTNRILIQRNDNNVGSERDVEDIRDILENSLKMENQVRKRIVPDERIFDPNALKKVGLDKESKNKIKNLRH